MTETPAAVRYRSIAADSARWDGFAFRDDDIVISTAPKCGTTWTQMICALLIFQTPDLPQSLDALSPWLDMLTRDRAEVIDRLETQRHRRFIKTHTPLDGLPFDERVTYICVARDPRDVALSWDNHVANMDVMAFITKRADAVGLDDVAEMLAEGPPVRADSPLERFWAWVDDDTPLEAAVANLRGLLHHLQTYWDERDRPNIVLLRYEDLKADLEGEMRGLARRLGIDVPEERWPVLVGAAGFDEMRARASETAPEAGYLWQDEQQFFHRGTSGQWREVLTEADVARYRALVAALVDPELAAWLHQGGSATSPR